MVYCTGKPIERVVHCLNKTFIKISVGFPLSGPFLTKTSQKVNNGLRVVLRASGYKHLKPLYYTVFSILISKVLA